LNEEAIKKPEKRSDYEKAKKLFKDINTIRLKKIVSLASSPAKTRSLTENLTEEERALYDYLFETISKWRNEILKKQGEERR
jgi:DNA replication initiation complex subunit (GINS family)